MATSGPLEDHITCCVCIEVYRDPQALKCLHTLCRECVDQLEKHGRVQCPECQEFTDMADVKNDFKTEGLVDLYNNKSIVSAPKKRKLEAKQNQLCEMCDDADNPIACKCDDCKQYLCEMCEQKHGKLKICKNHNISPIQDIVEMAQVRMRKLLELLTSENDDMSKKSGDIDEMIRDIKNKSLSQVQNIKQHKEEIINKIESHCDELINTIKKSSDYSITNLATLKQQYSKSEKQLQIDIQLVNKMIKSQDISAFTEVGQKIQDNIRNKAKNIKDNLPAVKNRANSPVKIYYTKNWHPENIVSVEMAYGIIPKPTTSNLKSGIMRHDTTAPMKRKFTGQVSYSKLLNHMYKKVKQVKVEHTFVKRICKANNELWGILNYCQMVIYNEDLEVLDTHDLKNIYRECARSITYSSIGKGSIVVAHDNNGGLHQYDMDGQHMTEILGPEGGYADVFCDQLNGKLYALMYFTTPSVLVFIHVNGSWVIESQTPMEYTFASRYDRLWVYQEKIYISSDKNDCIYAFNTDGKLLWQAGGHGRDVPGKMVGPDLCNIDSEGNILVADHNNDRLQLYSSDTRNWSVLMMDDRPVKPIQAVVGEDGKHIWVVTEDSLIKYSKV